jgi:transposase
MEPKQWVGIDVSGKRLEVFVRPIQRMLKVANSPAGLATLVSELLAIDPALIVVEATANWHLATVAALSGAGLPVAVINAFTHNSEQARRPKLMQPCLNLQFATQLGWWEG